MSNLTEKLEKAIINAKGEHEKRLREETNKEYSSLIENAEKLAKEGEFNISEVNLIGYRETTKQDWYLNRKEELLKEDWEKDIAKYACCLKKAKKLKKEHDFLNWDEEREQRIINTGRINIISKMMDSIPEYESKGDYQTLIGIKCLIELLEAGKI